MATVNAEVRFAPQLTAWFTANPTKVLQDGEIVYCSDGANIGKYVIGDNSTQLSALTFYGGISSSGLTIGTTTITSGTNTRILYNNNGVVGEYTVTGTGTTAVLSTSPTFTTDITTPLIIGGTAVGSTIQYKGTSGIGTSTVAAHQFLVGNNGATTAMSVYNSGIISIGNYALPAAQRLVTIGQDTAFSSIGSLVGTTASAAIYMNKVTPSGTNYFLMSDSLGNHYVNGGMNGGNLSIRLNNSQVLGMNTTACSWTPLSVSAGTPIPFQIFLPNNTGQTLSTNAPSFKVTGNTKQWATGALATQYFNYFSANTVAFVGASTATNVYGLYVEAATAGANATITNNYAAGFSGNVNILTANSATDGFMFRSTVGDATTPAMYSSIVTPASDNYILRLSSSGASPILNATSNIFFRISNTPTISIASGQMSFSESVNIGFGTTTGSKLGATNLQKLGIWGATPIVQPTTAVAASTFVTNTSLIANDTATFDGYTIGQVVKALRNTGLLA